MGAGGFRSRFQTSIKLLAAEPWEAEPRRAGVVSLHEKQLIAEGDAGCVTSDGKLEGGDTRKLGQSFYDEELGDAARIEPDFFCIRIDQHRDLVFWDVYEVEECGPVSKGKLLQYSALAAFLDESEHGVFNSLTIIDPLENRQVFSEREMLSIGGYRADAA
jgi:hypothetical protein